MCQIDWADGCWVSFGGADRRARKEHRCGDCGRVIQPGETYRVSKGLSDSYFMEFKECQQCQAASQWLIAVCRGYLFRGIGEELQEHWDEEWQLRCLGLGKLVIGWGRDWKGISPLQVDSWVKSAVAHANRAMAVAA